MKNFIRNVVLILVLSMVILGSYNSTAPLIKQWNFIEQSQGDQYGSFKNVFQDTFEGLKTETVALFNRVKNISQSQEKTYDFETVKAVWISYQEFNVYRNSVDENNAKNFKEFFRSILENCNEMNINTVIVQVRAFGDALYPSDYYPWAACISDAKGIDPGYDPLKIMVKEAHDQGIRIEAWINPYRVASDDEIDILPDDDPAKQWAENSKTARNVLSYDDALYYNPASNDVQKLIKNGVKEIVKNYDVDGVHMDDYFYPEFTEMNYLNTFDSKEYETYKENNVNKKTKSIANWRRNNVNELIKEIYSTCHKYNKTFGISPSGNLNTLRSEYGTYADIDTWIEKSGYVDYLMPQVYWGFTHDIAPFQAVLEQWESLFDDSDIKLYVGLQLYRYNNAEESLASDYDELQSADCFENQLEIVTSDQRVSGFSIFSYQYLDVDDTEYIFESTKFLEDRKEVLRECKKLLGYLQY